MAEKFSKRWWVRTRAKQTNNKKRRSIILPSAIEAYRNKKQDDYYWIKSVSKEDILEDLKQSVPRFKFHTDPWKHQAQAFFLARVLDQFLFFLDMGAGKSKLVLDNFVFRRLNNEKMRRMLVLVGGESNILGWVDQVAEHRPELKAVALVGTREERWAALQDTGHVFILNYDGLMSFISELGQNKKGDGKRFINHKMAREFAKLFDMLVLDESHNLGNSNSLVWRMVNALCKVIKVRYGMTGTPFGRDPLPLWSQFFLIDRGETLGTTLGMFRAAYYTETENYFGGFDYTFNEKWIGHLRRVIRNRSIRYEEAEFSDLPPAVYKQHRVTFAEDAEEYYNKVWEELKHAKGDYTRIENSFIRMRQACAGFLSATGEEDEKLIVPFYTNPKLDELETIIDGMPWNEKVIIFHEFVPTGTAIVDMLTRKKIKCSRIGKGGGKVTEAVKRFMTKPEYRAIVVNNHSSFTEGVNPQHVCRRIVFFDSPVSPITRRQAEKRVHRSKQEKRVYIHDLVVAGSVDETVLDFLKEGKDLFEALASGKPLPRKTK